MIRVGNLSARRDYSDVRCVVDAYAGCSSSAEARGSSTSATGSAVSLASVLDRLLALATAEIRVEIDPARLRPADNPLLVGSPRLLMEATGWRPTRSLDETLADVLNAARQGVVTE